MFTNMSPYAIPIFVAGIGSVLELYPTPRFYPVRRQFDGLTDAQRLASDWHRVGYALYSALNSQVVEHNVERGQPIGTNR